jgi:ribosomal protein S18 acetylase RimI-like enzyme
MPTVGGGSTGAPSLTASLMATSSPTVTAMYLWVLEQNVAAQGFYQALGGERAETRKTSLPGGVPDRLNGSPNSFRMAWPDATSLGARLRD